MAQNRINGGEFPLPVISLSQSAASVHKCLRVLQSSIPGRTCPCAVERIQVPCPLKRV
jgi:hypothetical protein